MRTLKLGTTLMLLGTLTYTMANVTIDAEVAAIQNATGEKRVALMNQFKTKVSTMSREDRTDAISQLRQKTQTRAQIRERSRLNQMEQTETMKRTQNMYQHQAAKQATQQGVAGGTANKFMGRK
mgnify:CR=1 FL=1